MDGLIKDLYYGLRSLRRAPAFALTATLALGLGTGATTAIFSVLDGVVLRPLPYANPERLFMLLETNVSKGLAHEPLSPVNFVDYRALPGVFEDAAAWWRPTVNLTSGDGDPIRANTIEASSNLFAVLGVRPHLGTGFPATGPLHGTSREVVISHRLWTERFSARPDIVGDSIRLGGDSYTVLGVMPRAFHFPGDTEIWQRLRWDLAQHSRGAHFMEGVARAKGGVKPEQIEVQLTTLTGRLARDFPATNNGWSVRATPLHREIVGFFGPALFVLLAAVSLLLVIACINVANLLLARASARDREVAIRAAIGASRWRLVRQFLSESLVLATAGSGLGLLIAYASIKGLVYASPIEIPRLEAVGMDARVLGFVTVLVAVTTLAFGLVPALFSAGTNLQGALKDGGGGAVSGRAARRTRSLLVVAEVGLAAMLLASAGLLVKSVEQLLREPPGFTPAGILTVNLEVSGAAYPDWPSVERFYSNLLESMRSRPGVVAVGATNRLPLRPGWRVPFAILGRPPVLADEAPMAQHISVDEGYFRALGVPVLRGRSFTERDTAAAPGVVVINETMARLYWPGQNPVGEKIVSSARVIGPLGRRLVDANEHEIVGVVGDVKNTEIQSPPEPAIYHTQRQFPFRNLYIAVRGTGQPLALAGLVREEVRRADPALPLSEMRPMERVLAEAVDRPRLLMALMSGFALLALALASVGIYGILAFAVGQRQREIGVRMALGAGRRDVLWLVLREGLGLALGGAVIGLLGAVLAGRSLRSVLHGSATADPLTFSAVLATVLLVSLLACLVPARRAAGLEPLQSLRTD